MKHNVSAILSLFTFLAILVSGSKAAAGNFDSVSYLRGMNLSWNTTFKEAQSVGKKCTMFSQVNFKKEEKLEGYMFMCMKGPGATGPYRLNLVFKKRKLHRIDIDIPHELAGVGNWLEKDSYTTIWKLPVTLENDGEFSSPEKEQLRTKFNDSNFKFANNVETVKALLPDFPLDESNNHNAQYMETVKNLGYAGLYNKGYARAAFAKHDPTKSRVNYLFDSNRTLVMISQQK